MREPVFQAFKDSTDFTQIINLSAIVFIQEVANGDFQVHLAGIRGPFLIDKKNFPVIQQYLEANHH